MVLISLIAAAFVLPLLLHAPQPESLREINTDSALQRIGSIIGTLAIGIVLIAMAAATFDAYGYSITPRMERLVGLSPNGVIKQGRYYQLLTSTLVHVNVVHLVSNLLTLALLSVYERHVGYKRFIIVFAVAALISSLVDLLLLPNDAISMGASGGICGLAAGFFLDHDEVTRADWLKGLVGVLTLVAIYSFAAAIATDGEAAKVNWVAHVWGAVGGALYIRLFGRRTTTSAALP